MISEYAYTQTMNQLEYNYKSKTWELPGFCAYNNGLTLVFKSRFDAHEFIYANLEE